MEGANKDLAIGTPLGLGDSPIFPRRELTTEEKMHSMLTSLFFERSELGGKIARLENSIEDEDLQPEVKKMREDQLAPMKRYYTILGNRMTYLIEKGY